jgi:hypothetical protein
VRNYLNNLHALAATKIPTFNIPSRRQSGGPVRSGETYLVGERGPEVFTASSSGRIAPHGESTLTGGSRSVTNNWYIYGTKMDPQELMREVDWRERTRGW